MRSGSGVVRMPIILNARWVSSSPLQCKYQATVFPLACSLLMESKHVSDTKG